MYPFIFHNVDKPSRQQPNYKITPPHNQRQEGIQFQQNLKQIFPKSFVFMILGKPGSGKTHVVNQMLIDEKIFSGKYDRILYIGVTQYQKVIQDKYNWFKSLDCDWISQKLNECRGWAKNILIVMDDVISQINSKNKDYFQQLLYNRRHIVPGCCVSFVITTQKFTSLPTWARVTSSIMLVFKINNSECKYISNELNIDKSLKQMGMIFNGLNENQFIFINSGTGKIYNHYFIQI